MTLFVLVFVLMLLLLIILEDALQQRRRPRLLQLLLCEDAMDEPRTRGRTQVSVYSGYLTYIGADADGEDSANRHREGWKVRVNCR